MTALEMARRQIGRLSEHLRGVRYQLIGIQASGLVDKETVARPDVDDHAPAAGRGREAPARHVSRVSRSPCHG